MHFTVSKINISKTFQKRPLSQFTVLCMTQIKRLQFLIKPIFTQQYGEETETEKQMLREPEMKEVSERLREGKREKTCTYSLQPHFQSHTFKYLHALVTAKLLAVSILSTCGTRLKGASVALGLVLWRKIASRNAVYSWSVFLMNNPPGESDKERGQRGEEHDGEERKWVIVGRRGVIWKCCERGRETGKEE